MTQLAFEQAIRQIERAMKRMAEAEVRKMYRERHNLIYVKEYTVKAHVYRRKPRKHVH